MPFESNNQDYCDRKNLGNAIKAKKRLIKMKRRVARNLASTDADDLRLGYMEQVLLAEHEREFVKTWGDVLRKFGLEGHLR